MYKQIETTKNIIMQNNGIAKPVATLQDDSSKQLVQIIKDDHCYVCCLEQNDGKYSLITHIFPELFEVLKCLPTPN